MSLRVAPITARRNQSLFLLMIHMVYIVSKVFNNRQSRGDTHAMAFGDWEGWIASPETQVS